MTKEEIKQLEERVYAIGSSLFPIDAFFNDIRDNKDPRYNKDKAYEDLKLIVDEIYRLRDKTKKSIKPTKTTKHSWCKDDDGNIDVFGYSEGFCNGPKCEICGYSFCHHCYPNRYSDENCNEHYICECGQHLKGKEKRCPNCDNLLDWGEDNE